MRGGGVEDTCGEKGCRHMRREGLKTHAEGRVEDTCGGNGGRARAG